MLCVRLRTIDFKVIRTAFVYTETQLRACSSRALHSRIVQSYVVNPVRLITSLSQFTLVICIVSLRYLTKFLEMALISVFIVECIDCCLRILCLDLDPIESSYNVIVKRHLTQSIGNARMGSMLTNLLCIDFWSFEIDKNVTCSTHAARKLRRISKLVFRVR